MQNDLLVEGVVGLRAEVEELEHGRSAAELVWRVGSVVPPTASTEDPWIPMLTEEQAAAVAPTASRTRKS
jgi:hypothetical protein